MSSMKAREFSFIFMFLAHKTHVINVDRTNQSSVLNCILQLLLELFPILQSVPTGSAVHSPISVLISPLRLSSDGYLCRLAAILTLCARDTGSGSLTNPSWCGCPWSLCWPHAGPELSEQTSKDSPGGGVSISAKFLGWENFHLCYILKNFQSKNRKALEPHFSYLLVIWSWSWTIQQERRKEMAIKSDWMNGVRVFTESWHWVFGI